MTERSSIVGVLISGGLDSAILVSHLLKQGRTVQPFYIQSNLVWQRSELTAAGRDLEAVACELLRPLVVLNLPLDDLYAGHWSVTGQQAPDDRTADEAVFMPGRNALLIIKAAVWCQLHGVDSLALAVLRNNPFGDATEAFFAAFQAALNCGSPRPLTLVRPFAELDKREVMRLGRSLPLQYTFSCIAPVGDLHCGRCNKCGERKVAFRNAEMQDPTRYSM